MKVAITGHTSGIGKAIYDGLGHEIIGFSRDNGHNINDIFHRMEIIKKVQDCDVFINNAHDRFSQVNMLNELYQDWQYSKGKLIINIGTDAVPQTAWQVVHRMYPVEKAAVHSAVEILQQDIEGRRVKITNLALGHVETEFNKDYKGPKLTFKTVIDTINWIIDQEQEIKSLVLSAKADWK
tara:strand:- start:72 stop:614 length:543 start_codon:yes stop_codon:yes gene_type:complete